MTGIGTLGEGPLHAALKEWYRQPGDRTEIALEGFVVDLVRGDELVEIQTRGFSKMRRKLDVLLDRHALRLVHPIAAERWIRRVDARGADVSRRRSPRRGQLADVCTELVSFPTLLSHPNFTLDVVLVREEEVREPARGARRRREWKVAERRLLDVVECATFSAPADLLALLPTGLADPFTTADLAAALGRDRAFAREVAYCLRTAGVLEAVGRSRAGVAHRRAGG
ncbi:MAG: hypothetical protein KC560_12015 [Myxococcales bacterium]|nr:hypothetical protein [Myxococcales bacterium]